MSRKDSKACKQLETYVGSWFSQISWNKIFFFVFQWQHIWNIAFIISMCLQVPLRVRALCSEQATVNDISNGNQMIDTFSTITSQHSDSLRNQVIFSLEACKNFASYTLHHLYSWLCKSTRQVSFTRNTFIKLSETTFDLFNSGDPCRPLTLLNLN